MKRLISILFISFFIQCCHSNQLTDYKPSSFYIEDPAMVIKETIEAQPSAQYYKPAETEVTDKYIKLYMVESGGLGLGFIAGGIAALPHGTKVVPSTIYYKHIGKLNLWHAERYDHWYVEILDKAGDYFYWVYTYDRQEAEKFIDAVNIMITKLDRYE